MKLLYLIFSALLGLCCLSAFAQKATSNVILQTGPIKPDFSTLPQITFFSINTRERVTTPLYNVRGEIPLAVYQKLNRLLRDHRTCKQTQMDKRLLQLMYKCAYHFKKKRVVIISAYRSTSAALHSLGKAIDFRIPGVSTEALVSYARTLGRVGVGYYPTVKYIHIEVRNLSYFWVDRSGQDQPSLNKPMKFMWARTIDTKWRPQTDLPWAQPKKEFLAISLKLTPP